MASDVDAGHPHCLPAGEHGGVARQSDPHDSARLAVPVSVNCTDCMLFGDYGRDGRDGQAKVKDAKSLAPIAITSAANLFTHVNRAALRNGVRYRSATPGASPPLNLLYCVHLK